MLVTILFILYGLIAIAIVLSLLVNGVRPAKTLAWLLAIFTIPVGGILLYIMVGRNRRKNKLIRIKKRIDFTPPLFDYNKLPEEVHKHRKIISLVERNCSFSPTLGNSVMYLKDGKTTFETIFQALETAVSFIHLQYYIFEEGELANNLLDLFYKKIGKGVKIRLIYDEIGSFSLSKSYLKKLRDMGVEVYPFLPFRYGRFLVALNYRNHRKIIVVDENIAFTGGINISDKYLKGDTDLGKWHDMHLKIEGPAVEHLNRVFLSDWLLVSEQEVDSPKKKLSRARYAGEKNHSDCF